MITLALSIDRMSEMGNGSFPGLDLLLQPEATLVSETCAATKGHEVVHCLCHCLWPCCFCLSTVLPPRALSGSMVLMQLQAVMPSKAMFVMQPDTMCMDCAATWGRVDVPPICLRPCWCLWSMLLSVVPAATRGQAEALAKCWRSCRGSRCALPLTLRGKEATFADVSITADSQLR